MMIESTSEKAAILREIEDLLALHSWFPKNHHYPHLWKWYKEMKWGSSEEVEG